MDLSTLGPYGGVLASLALGALGLPIPEELVLLAAGAAAYRGLASPGPLLAVAALAVAATDALVFALGRRFGPAVVSRAPARWLLPARSQARIARLASDHGGKLVLAARFLPGLRAPTFLLLGAQGMPVRRFLARDALGIALGVPSMLALGYLASSSVTRLGASIAHGEHLLALAAVLAVSIAAIATAIRTPRG